MRTFIIFSVFQYFNMRSTKYQAVHHIRRPKLLLSHLQLANYVTLDKSICLYKPEFSNFYKDMID